MRWFSAAALVVYGAVAFGVAAACIPGELVLDATSADGAPEGGARDGGSSGTDARDGDAEPVIPAGCEGGACGCAARTPAPLFCSDFDNGPFDTGWTRIVPAEGRMGETSETFRSSPFALRSTVAADAGSTDTYAYLSKTFTVPNVARVRMGFDFMLTQSVPGPHALVAQLNIRGALPADTKSLALAVAEGDTTIQESTGAIRQHRFTRPLVKGAWARIELELTIGTPSTLAVTVDGAPALEAAPVTLDPTWKSNDVVVIIGFAYITSRGATWEALFDDVTVDATGP